MPPRESSPIEASGTAESVTFHSMLSPDSAVAANAYGAWLPWRVTKFVRENVTGPNCVSNFDERL